MLNTINTNKNKSKFLVDDILGNMYLLPKWEKIKSFSILKNKFFFLKDTLNINLFRKFSSKNMLEKYQIKTDDDIEMGKMDLRIYKDCVYIINLDIKNTSCFIEIFNKLIQTAIEKALYNTTEKELKINLNFSSNINSKIKKFLTLSEFLSEESQSEYEKEMFGETYIFKMTQSSVWAKRIKQMPILLNK